MIVQVPKEFQRYIALLLDSGYADSESGVVQKLIEEGLIQVLQAIHQGALGNPEGEVEYFANCDTKQVAIWDDFKGFSKVKSLSDLLKTSEAVVLTLLVYTGLMTEGYYFLRHEVPEYRSNRKYRMVVDEMPHDPDFEAKEKVPELTMVIEENEKLDIGLIH